MPRKLPGKMVRFSLIADYDQQQALRVRRFLMAGGTYLLCYAFVFLSYLVGILDLQAFVLWGVIYGSINVFFYALFRSGANVRFMDPSLTAIQLLVSTTAVMFLAYHARGARGAFIMLYSVPFLFGALRLRTRELFLIGAFALSIHAAAIARRSSINPVSVDLKVEFIHGVALAGVLTVVSLLGGYISALRKRLKESVNTIREIADRDALTGAFNRHHLIGTLEREKRNSEITGRSFFLCLIDLDRFKNINDALGHLAGDEVLKTFALNVPQWLRASDYFARYGGEEFVVVLRQANLSAALACAERVRLLTESLSFPGLVADLHVTASIGVTEYVHDEAILEMFARADTALYRAKANGRNRVEHESASTGDGLSREPASGRLRVANQAVAVS